MRASHTHPQSLSMSHEDEAAGNSTEGPANVRYGGKGGNVKRNERPTSRVHLPPYQIHEIMARRLTKISWKNTHWSHDGNIPLTHDVHGAVGANGDTSLVELRAIHCTSRKRFARKAEHVPWQEAAADTRK